MDFYLFFTYNTSVQVSIWSYMVNQASKNKLQFVNLFFWPFIFGIQVCAKCDDTAVNLVDLSCNNCAFSQEVKPENKAWTSDTVIQCINKQSEDYRSQRLHITSKLHILQLQL